MSETLPLSEILRQAVDRGLASTHTQVPATVVEYDKDTNRAKVQLIVSHVQRDPETNEREYYRPAQLVNVPVQFPSVLTWPVQKGDPGWVEFAERSMDEYKANGGDSAEPKDARRFDLTDAVFSPCYFRGEYDATDDAVVLSTKDGPLKIRDVAAAATKALAIAEKCMTNFNELKTSYDGHEHTYVDTTTAGSSTNTTTGGPTAGSMENVAASNVEAEE